MPQSFLRAVYCTQVAAYEIDKFADRYIQENRNAEEDVENFFVSIKSRPPKSVQYLLAAVKTFLIENSIELPVLFWRHLNRRKKGNRALTLDRIPSNQELKQILQHLPINGKTLMLVLLSSGARLGETLSLKIKDLDLNKDPARIYLRGDYTKSGNSRIAFISCEAKEALIEWFKVRDKCLDLAVRRSSFHTKNPNDDRIFPYEGILVNMQLTTALKKAGFLEKDGSTNRATIHPHVLRKFFRTRMGAVIPVDVTEALMGHEGYLTEVYRKYSQEELGEFYRKGESSLMIYSNGAEISKLRVEVEEKNKQL